MRALGHPQPTATRARTEAINISRVQQYRNTIRTHNCWIRCLSFSPCYQHCRGLRKMEEHNLFYDKINTERLHLLVAHKNVCMANCFNEWRHPRPLATTHHPPTTTSSILLVAELAKCAATLKKYEHTLLRDRSFTNADARAGDGRSPRSADDTKTYFFHIQNSDVTILCNFNTRPMPVRPLTIQPSATAVAFLIQSVDGYNCYANFMLTTVINFYLFKIFT